MFSNSCRYKIFNATNALNKRLNCSTPSAEAQQKTTQNSVVINLTNIIHIPFFYLAMILALSNSLIVVTTLLGKTLIFCEISFTKVYKMS